MNESVLPLPQFAQQRSAEAKGSLWGAAFRLENDINNIYQSARRGQMPLDTDFDIAAAAEGSDLWADHMDRLALAQSQPEFDSIGNRIRQESADRARVQAAGWGGLGAAMVAGVLSPTTLIPLTGQARGARGVQQAFALAAGAATAQEVPLLLNQQLRTPGESAINIAAGTVLGGMLGSAAVYLRASDRARLARGMQSDAEPPQMGYIVRQEDGSYSRVGAGAPLALPAGIARSPADFNAMQQVSSAYEGVVRAARQEDWAGVRRLANDETAPPAQREFARDLLEYPTVRFKTAKGSSYELHSDGTTTRTKAARSDLGHEGDSGLKDRTSKTVYTDINAAHLSAAGIANLGPKGARIVIKDGKATLLIWNEQAGKWGASPSSRDIPIYTDPKVGRYPLELWKAADDVPSGYEGYRGMHAGNAITEFEGTPSLFSASPEVLARALRDEKIQPHLTTEQPLPARETAGVGAQRAGARETPFIPVRDEATGEISYVPTIDPSVRPDAGQLAGDVGGVLTQLARVNPVARVIQQPGMPVKSDLARNSMMMLSDGGLEYTGARHGISPAPGGTVEDRLGFYFARMAEAFREQYDAYLRYLGRKDNFANRRLTDFQATFGIAPGGGKLSFREFKEQVMDSFHNGYQSPISEANEVARAWSSSYFGKFNEAMLEATEGRGAKALYEILDDADPMRNYISHIYSVDKIVQDREGFINLVADHLQTNTAAVAMRRWQKLRQREEQDLSYEELLQLDAEGARIEFDNIDGALRQLPKDQDFSPEMQRVRELRDQRRQLIEDEFERLMDESTVYRRGDEISESAARLKARETTREQYRQLTDEIARAESQVAPSDLSTVDQRRALKRRKSALLKSFGALQEKQAEAIRRIERNEAQNMAALERFQDQAIKLNARLDNIDDARLDAELARLEKQFDRAMAQIEKSEKQLERLSRDAGTEFEPTERISIAEAQRGMREQRAEAALERFGKAASYDRDGARQALRDRMRGAREYVNRVNSARAERNARLRDTIKKNDPEQAHARIRDMEAGRAARRGEFERWLEEAGVGEFDLDAGRFDFSETAQQYASALSYKITGSPLRIAQLDTLPGLKGPMKNRVLDIPYEQKKAYLEMDSERVLAVYTRSMGADIELYRAFGSVNGGNMLQNVQEELRQIERNLRTRTADADGKAITEARRAKNLKAHERGSRDILLSLEHAITRLRGMAGMPDDPSSFWYRAGRTAMFMNVATMMGSAAVTSIPDLGRAVMAHGVTRVFRDSWMPMIGGLVSDSQRTINKAQIRQLKLMNIGVEMFTQQRAHAAFDITMDTAGRTRGERLVELIGVKTPQVALFGPQTDMARILAGLGTMSRMIENIDSYAAGRMRPGDPELQYMARSGLEPALMERIAREFNSPNGHSVVNGTKVPNLEGWTDYAALRAFSAAMQRESNNIVVQPGLERLNIADKNILARLVFQFRSFTMGAHSKMLLAGLQQRDMAAFRTLQGVMFSLALGALSYYIWARTTSERATEEMRNATWETWLDQAIYRSGLMGLFSEVQSVGSKIPATADFVTFAGSDLAGRRPTSIMGAVAGPSFGQAETIANVLAGMDEPTQGTVSQARKLIPYQNVFYLRRALNILEEQLAETLNIPESRR